MPTIAVLPLITAFVCSFALWFKHNRDWRRSFVYASLTWSVYTVVLTEGLSVIQQFTFSGLLLGWSLFTIAQLGLYLRMYRWTGFISRRVKLSPDQSTIWVGSIVAILVITGFIALIAPPNSWDSMVYHLVRVAVWTQNQSVTHYATMNLNQSFMAPFSEFAMAQFYILGGSDQFVNLVQWFSMLGCIIAASLVAQQLGADRRGQILAALLVATLPVGILEASSSYNDYVVAYMCICFAWFVLLLIQAQSWSTIIGAGISLGLAMLSKSTAYVYLLPFVLWLGWYWLRQTGLRAWRHVLLIGVISIGLNAGHFLRNYMVFETPLGYPAETRTYINQIISLPALVSNLTRNLSLQVATPVFPVNQFLTQVVTDFHERVLGINVSDPRTTYLDWQFAISTVTNHEHFAANWIHLLLVLLAACVFFARRDLRTQVLTGRYLLAASSAFILFCLMITWQFIHTRLHLPIFILMTPLVATVLVRGLSTRAATIAHVAPVVFAIPYLFVNALRPLIPMPLVSQYDSAWPLMLFSDAPKFSIVNTPRNWLYFADKPDLFEPYMQVSDLISTSDCNEVGILQDEKEWLYPFWVLFEEHHPNINIKEVDVANPTNVTTDLSFNPCVIVSVASSRATGQTYTLSGQRYQRIFTTPILSAVGAPGATSVFALPVE